MKDLEKKLDAVLQQMRDFIDELQERESAYPMVFIITQKRILANLWMVGGHCQQSMFIFETLCC